MRKAPAAWRHALAREFESPYFEALCEFVDRERREHDVFPPEPQVFAALESTPPEAVRVVILGQDPYHDHGQAHGLAFSVARGTPPPPSLRNIFKELQADAGVEPPVTGDLTAWAARGVLLLNTVLTVRAHAAHSHRGRGWERFTDAVLGEVVNRRERVVFVLWGAAAQQKRALIDERVHAVISSAHPSPLSAHRGFFGSRPFSQANSLLVEGGREPVDWRIG
ncbi:MAG TPA: uracil-DNA glycosylase [Blastocatellia bacterium]|nr:uracil-DNA glycosylase [Blastocatellia bacterium]